MGSFRRKAAAVAVLAMLSACGAPSSHAVMEPAQLQQAVAAGRVDPAIQPPGRLEIGPRPADPGAPRPGYTVATDSAGNGIQIEYLAPDGRSHLWYPGSAAAVSGRYRYGVLLPEDGSAGRISDVGFLYPAASRDALGRAGGDWQEREIGDYRSYVIASMPGDVFGLASGRVPYVRRGCDLPRPMVGTVEGQGVCRR